MAKRKKATPDKITPAHPSMDAGVDPLDLAAPLSASVRIEEVALSESKVIRVDEVRTEAMRGVLRIRVHDGIHSIIEGTNSFWVKIPFSLLVTGEYEGGTKEAELFRIEATFMLRYNSSSKDTLNDETIAAFAKTNGVYHAWPYWREFAQSMSLRMGLPPVTLPVFRLT